MKDSICILDNATFPEEVKSLKGGLDFSGIKCDVRPIGDAVFPSPDDLNKDCLVVVFFTDRTDLRSIEISNYEPRRQVSGEHPICIALVNDGTVVPTTVKDYFVVLTRSSREKIRREVVQYYLQQKFLGRGYRVFVGRAKEIDQFESIRFSSKTSYCKAVFICGRAGTGREAFARECIRINRGRQSGIYEPYCLSLGAYDSIEAFILQLYKISAEPQFKEEMESCLKNGSIREKTQMAVSLLNSLFEEPSDYLILYDSGSCLRNDKKISEWFLSILNSSKLESTFNIYVISSVLSPGNSARLEDPYAMINLYGLSLPDRRKLIYQYSEDFISLDENDVEKLAQELSYSPAQIIYALEKIKEKGTVKPIIDNIDTYKKIGDGKVVSLLQSFKDNEEQRNILILMAKLEFSSKNILNKVMDNEDDVEKVVSRLEQEGVLERFSNSRDFYHLDTYICDFIRRNKIRYTDPSFETYIQEKLNKIEDDTELILQDYSLYLYKTKQSIKSKSSSISSSDTILPSVVINAIIEEYDNKDWKKVIAIAKYILQEKHLYYSEVTRTIQYWYCLALAREKDEQEFFNQLDSFKDEIDYRFLKGFFYRIKGSYVEAEREYRKVLKINPRMQRARRELVIVLLATNQFNKALDLAESNYENDPENPYHVNAYFRCLLRKQDRIWKDDEKLKELLDMSRTNPAFGEAYKDGMSFEYTRFVMKGNPSELLDEANRLQRRYPNSDYIKVIINDFRSYQGIELRMKPVAYD